MNQEVRRRKRSCYIYIWRHYSGIHTKGRTTKKTQKQEQLSRPRLERGTFQIRSRRTECIVHRILLLIMLRTRATHGVRSYLVLGNHFVTPTGSYAVQGQWWQQPHHRCIILKHCAIHCTVNSRISYDSLQQNTIILLNNINPLFVTTGTECVLCEVWGVSLKDGRTIVQAGRRPLTAGILFDPGQVHLIVAVNNVAMDQDIVRALPFPPSV